MEKKRKLLIGVLCSGLGALTVDQFVIGGPDSATASAISFPADSTDELNVNQIPAFRGALSASDSKRVDSASTRFVRFADRLDKVQLDTVHAESSTKATKNPFSVPLHWLPKKIDSSSVVSLDNQGEAADKGFLARYRLDATLTAKSESRAVIGNRVLLEGDTIDQYRLIEISARHVLWESPDAQRMIVMRVEQE